ncbi:restriction endonuclease subunit S [Bacillus pumilus]|uniref:restriction endonuclease subunit S n=1 Tax=Bacillus pumilus TaxID=1408 RepID=UPI0007766D87|nr:restriction endonuclease subunit S [Bacillus pumilus]AMM98641.1 hypothetical protein UP12_15355 [Bacillus pumilus]MDH3149073.1 restriction endonuclease subunit S [Bacillus pumilus]
MSDKIIKSPPIRFAGFTDAWEQRKLGEVLTKNIQKNTDLAIENVESVSNKTGFTKQTEQFDDYSVASADLSNYYVIREKQFAYNPSRINVGSIAYKAEGEEKSVVSPLYVSFSTTHRLEDSYLWNWLKTSEFERQRQTLSEGGVRDTLSFNQLAEMYLLAPNIEEQQKIGAFFKTLDDTIPLHQRKLELLKGTKKSLLQKMFPKDGANVPEIRFEGFTDAWEQRKLKDVSTYSNGGSFENEVQEKGRYELVTLKSVNMDGNLVHSGRYVNIEVPTLTKGTLVMILSEQSPGLLGMTAQIPKDNTYILNQRVAEIRPNQNVDSYFLSMAINKNQLYFSRCGAGTKVQNISKLNVENYEFPCPSLQEQQKIGQFLATMDHLITLHQCELNSLKNLKKSLLQQMFI